MESNFLKEKPSSIGIWRKRNDVLENISPMPSTLEESLRHLALRSKSRFEIKKEES